MDRWQRIQELFARAAALPAEERDAFLREACPDDPELRAEVQKLLAHDDPSDSGAPRRVQYRDLR